MRAFVTGASGFVGINLVRELAARDWEMVAIHRCNANLRDLEKLPITFVEGDVTDIDSLRRAMPLQADVVFHVAGDTTLWTRNRARQHAINVDGTRNVATVALEKRARRFVQTSSIAAFGQHHGRIDEETPSNALKSSINYLRTKRLAELEVDAAIARGLDAVIVNPSHIAGPYDRSNWSRMIRMVDTEKLPGVPPGRGSWAHVREVVLAHIAAAERGRTGHRYLLGGTDASFLEVVKTIGEITGKQVPDKAMKPAVLYVVGALSELGSYVTRREPDVTLAGAKLVCEEMTCDSSKAIRELGYRAVPLVEMFRDCYEWMRRVASSK